MTDHILIPVLKQIENSNQLFNSSPERKRDKAIKKAVEIINHQNFSTYKIDRDSIEALTILKAVFNAASPTSDDEMMLVDVWCSMPALLRKIAMDTDSIYDYIDYHLEIEVIQKVSIEWYLHQVKNDYQSHTEMIENINNNKFN